MSSHNKFHPDVAETSQMYPPLQPPAYPGPPPPAGFGVYPHPQPQYVSSGQTTVIQGGGGGVTMVTSGPTMIPGGVVVVPMPMGSKPTAMTCRSCQAEIITRVDTKATMRTHLFAALLCLIGCWPCVCVPYCMDSCMSAEHYCPNCNAYIGTSYS